MVLIYGVYGAYLWGPMVLIYGVLWCSFMGRAHGAYLWGLYGARLWGLWCLFMGSYGQPFQGIGRIRFA